MFYYVSFCFFIRDFLWWKCRMIFAFSWLLLKAKAQQNTIALASLNPAAVCCTALKISVFQPLKLVCCLRCQSTSESEKKDKNDESVRTIRQQKRNNNAIFCALRWYNLALYNALQRWVSFVFFYLPPFAMHMPFFIRDFATESTNNFLQFFIMTFFPLFLSLSLRLCWCQLLHLQLYFRIPSFNFLFFWVEFYFQNRRNKNTKKREKKKLKQIMWIGLAFAIFPV